MEFIFPHHKNATRLQAYGHSANNDTIVPLTPELQELMELWVNQAWPLFVEFHSNDPDVQYLFFSTKSAGMLTDQEVATMFETWQGQMGIPTSKIIPPKRLRHIWITTSNGGLLPDDAPVPDINGMAAMMGHSSHQWNKSIYNMGIKRKHLNLAKGSLPKYRKYLLGMEPQQLQPHSPLPPC